MSPRYMKALSSWTAIPPRGFSAGRIEGSDPELRGSARRSEGQFWGAGPELRGREAEQGPGFRGCDPGGGPDFFVPVPRFEVGRFRVVSTSPHRVKKVGRRGVE